MPSWLPLDPVQHARAGWFQYRDYGFASRDHRVPVVLPEITRVLPWYPLAFEPNQQGSRFELVALLSLTAGQNAYWMPQGQWHAPYVPSYYRGYPFRRNRDGQLCIDRDSGLFVETIVPGALPIFDGGKFAEVTAQVNRFHEQRDEAMALTRKLVDQMHQAGLISAWAIQWQPKDRPHTLKGYCGTNEERLRDLPPEQYAELAHSGALGLAYAQVFSRPRIGDLQYRHRSQPWQGGEAKRHLHAVENESLDEMFGQLGDDLSFDFDREND